MGDGEAYRKSGRPHRTFAANLRRAMNAREYFPPGLAARIGADAKRVRRLLARDVHARLDEVEALAKVLRVPPEALAFEDPAAFSTRFPAVGGGGSSVGNREVSGATVTPPRP